MKQGQTSAAGKYGRYRILAEVGRGRTGVVYKAEDPIIGRTVALKVLVEPSGVATDERMAFRARLRAEAELAGVLHHPHIVTLYDVGDEFLVMEFLEGRPLGSVIAQDGPLDPARALRLGRQLAQALDFAHARGIVHRALRPRNVMVLHSGDVKLMDFGIASPRLRAVVPDARLEPDVYLAPERRAGRRADARSDVYSLGVVMHELLTGLPPATEAAASAGAAPATGSRMEAVVRRALSPEPSDRYASAGDFVAALEAAIAQEEHPLSRLVASSVPPAADEPPGAVRTRRACAPRPAGGARSRERLGLGMAAVAAAAALVAGFSGWMPEAAPPRPAPGPALAAAVAAAPRRAPARAPAKAEATPSPAPEPAGALLVSSTPPGARVLIDGVEKGTTPFLIDHRAGPALVRAEKPGYHAASRLAWVFPGRPIGLSIPLRSEAGLQRVDILSLPDGAELAIDGELVGRTNALGLELAQGFHVVVVRRAGFLPWVQELEVGPATQRVIATLEVQQREESAPGR